MIPPESSGGGGGGAERKKQRGVARGRESATFGSD